jgi:citrate lyase beta subunit
MPKSPRRSLLFTPGDSIKKMNKVAQVGTDAVILDLEDAVAIDQKVKARQMVAEALLKLDFGRTERLVRINGPETDFYAADVAVMARANLEGIVAPKIEFPEQIQLIDEALTTAEVATGRPAGEIGLFALIETALGVMNVKEIAQSSPRLEGLLFCAEDLAADMGAIRSQAGWEVLFARSAVVTAAAAYGLAAIDAVYLDLNDPVGLEDDALFGRQLGYTGKMAIHPGQVEVFNRAFSPSEEEIAQAERLLAAFRVHEAAGSGVFTLDGRMVDRPIVVAAERLLERARLSGMLDRGI